MNEKASTLESSQPPLRRGGPLEGVVKDLLEDLKSGKGDGDERRRVEDWLRALSDKYPEFEIQSGLRDYYLAEADRLRDAFASTTQLVERLSLGRSIEGYLEKSAEIDRKLV
ncbi:MAG: hypothetical protein KY432_02185 [Acidobacteria bacterium]|nr:hypothetical protein [Acidobacteriota bacterium]